MRQKAKTEKQSKRKWEKTIKKHCQFSKISLIDIQLWLGQLCLQRINGLSIVWSASWSDGLILRL